VKEEFDRAVGFLKSYDRRLAAVLMLKELALNSPTLFNIHIQQSQVMKKIFVAIGDSRLAIRRRAVEAIIACMHMISKRSKASKHKWYYRIFHEAGEVKSGTHTHLSTAHMHCTSYTLVGT